MYPLNGCEECNAPTTLHIQTAEGGHWLCVECMMNFLVSRRREENYE